MRLLKTVSLWVLISSICFTAYAQPVFQPTPVPLQFVASGGTVSVYPYQLKIGGAVLSDNGDGTASITVSSSGGGGSATGAAGNESEVQYNASNSFGASNNLTFHATSSVLQVTGSVISLNATSNILNINANGGAYHLPYSFGSSGQVITLQSNGTSVWQTPSITSTTPSSNYYGQFVPYTGATGSVFLGNYNISGRDANFDNNVTASSAVIGGGIGGVEAYSVGSGIGTLGFNSLGYNAEVAGYGALMQSDKNTGTFTMFSESNVGAGLPHAHTQALSWDNTGRVTIPVGLNTIGLDNFRDFTFQSATGTTINVSASGTINNLTATSYLDLPNSTVGAPPAGTARLHGTTTNGFTRAERIDEGGTITLGRDNLFIVRNTTATTISRGQPVYVTGSTGNIPNVAPARSNSTTTLPAIGVAFADITSGSFGQVMKLGILSNFNTSAFASGDQLWVSPTNAGSLVNTRPAWPFYVQRVGSVLVSGAGNGSILVTIAPFVGTQESGTNASSFQVTNLSATGQVQATGGVLTSTATASVLRATSYAQIGSLTGLIKGVSGVLTTAVSGIDYQPAGSYLTDGKKFVPYTGATGNVVLGNYSLYSSGAVSTVGATARTLEVLNTATTKVLCINNSTPYYLPQYFGASGQVPVLQNNGSMIWDAKGGGSGVTYYQTVEDEGVPLAQETTLNFVGDLVTATDSGGKTVVTISTPTGNASGAVAALFDGGGSAISTGSIVWFKIPYAITVKEWSITSYATCPTLVCDVGTTDYAGFDMNNKTSIAGTEKPTLTNAQKNEDKSLTTWSTSVPADKYMYFTISSADSSTQAVVSLIFNRLLPAGSGGGGHTIEDEGVPLTQRTNLDFQGAGVTVTDGGAGPDSTIVTIPGGGATTSSGSILFTFSGGNSAIATGADAWVVVPYNATIKEWQVTTYSTCPTLVVDIYKGNYAGFAPYNLMSIDGSEPPTVTNAMRGSDGTLSTWSTTVNANDYIYAKVRGVDSATTAVVYIGLNK